MRAAGVYGDAGAGLTMQIIRLNRGAVALGLFIVALAGVVVSSQRAASAAAMATAATRFLEGL